MESAKTNRPLSSFPPLLLVLGTDLAGKDHFANVVTDAYEAAGTTVERRRGAFRARPDRRRSSEEKSRLNLWLEWAFLATLPLHCRLLPYLLAWLILLDLRFFRQPDRGAVIVVSHTAIRLLAFAFGHLYAKVEDIRMPAFVGKALRSIVPATGARTVVLDIEHRVRAARLAARVGRGTLDHFDRYMGKDPVRSERIEHFLVWLATTYLQAVCVQNNNASDAELLSFLRDGQQAS